jgi:hypothetical protein
MDSLQDSSIKIKKKPRNTKVGERNYICGGCQRAYKSYPALYLHIKRKHNGVRPINTRTSKPISPITRDKIHTGRPQKPSHDVDCIPETQTYLENAQSELLGFLGERLKVVSMMDSKSKLETIVASITSICDEAKDDGMAQIKKQIEELYQELKDNTVEGFDVELDFDAFQEIDKEQPLKILVWFLLWLGKYIVKADFLRDLTYVFAKIWKVLVQKQLQVQDLDNKLVWNGVMKECDPYIPTFTNFEHKKELVYEFVSKTCHLIGKIFEEEV